MCPEEGLQWLKERGHLCTGDALASGRGFHFGTWLLNSHTTLSRGALEVELAVTFGRCLLSIFFFAVGFYLGFSLLSTDHMACKS